MSVFVCGSMAKDPPPAYADVDLRVVIEVDQAEASYYEVKRGVPLEWVFVPKRRFDSREELLNASFLALELVNGVIIYDPMGWLGQVRDDIRSVYGHPSYRIARSQRLLEAAWSLYEGIQKRFDVGGAVPLWDMRCAIFWTGETPSLLLNDIPNHRRLLVGLQAVGERLNSPELYPMGMETIGANRVEASEVEGFLNDMLNSITYINSVSEPRHFHLSLGKREYWEHGISQMLAEGYHREAVWPILTLMSAIQPTLAHLNTPESLRHYLRCRHFLDRIGFLSKTDFHQKLIKLDEWMEKVELLIARQRLTHFQ
jgi:hypothetical protein